MRFGFKGNNRIDIFYLEKVGLVLRSRCKLFDNRAFVESDIVFIGRNELIGILFRCSFDEFKKRTFLFLSIDNEYAVKNFMSAMFGIHLRKTEHFAVGKFPSEFFTQIIEVLNFFIAQSQTFLCIICDNIIDIDDGIGLFIDFKYLLVDTIVHALQHGIMLGISIGDREIFLYAGNTFKPHVLRNFHGIGTPRGNHLFTGTDKPTVETGLGKQLRPTEKPTQLFDLPGR